MAEEATLGGSGVLFKGEDKRFILRLQTPRNWDATLLGDYVMPDMSAWTIYFTVKQRVTDADADALINREVDGFAGTFDDDPAVNTQYAFIDIDDLEMDLFPALSGGKTYFYAWKRMDDNAETVLLHGAFAPQVAAGPDEE